MANDVIKLLSAFDLDQPVVTTIIFDSDEEEIKFEKHDTVTSFDIYTTSTSKTVQEESKAEEYSKSSNLFELSCQKHVVQTNETLNASRTETMNVFFNESNDTTKNIFKNLPILVEEDEITSNISEIKVTKRKITLPGCNEKENNAIKRISLNKELDAAMVTNNNNVTENSVTNSYYALKQNIQCNITRSNYMKRTVKDLAENLLQTCDKLHRNGYNNVTDLQKLDYQNYICPSMITAIETILSPIKKYEIFSIKLVEYASVLCDHKYSHLYILELLNRVVAWVKSKKSITNTTAGSNFDIQPSDNNKLSKSTKLNNLTSNANNTCLYLNGPPGREINISVDAVLLKQVTTQNSKIQTFSGTENSTAPEMSDKRNKIDVPKCDKTSTLQQHLKNVPQQRNTQNTSVTNPKLNEKLNQCQRSTYTSQYLPQANENLTNQKLTQPNYANVQMIPQNSSHSQLPLNFSNIQQNIHQDCYSMPNQNLEYNKFLPPSYESTITRHAAKRHLPQMRELSAGNASQTIHPLAHRYNQNQYQREANMAYPVQQTQPQTSQYQHVNNLTYHQRPEPHVTSQLQHSISNTLYPSPDYPALRQRYNQIVPPRQLQIPTMPTSINQWILNNTIQPLSSDYRHRLPNQEIARSTSTDSGFTSPVNFNTSVEQPTANNLQEELNPIITHVTSLHPEAVFIEEGSCSVCSNLTTQKCIGCYSCYYCGIECQQRDWNNHQYICNKMGTG